MAQGFRIIDVGELPEQLVADMVEQLAANPRHDAVAGQLILVAPWFAFEIAAADKHRRSGHAGRVDNGMRGIAQDGELRGAEQRIVAVDRVGPAEDQARGRDLRRGRVVDERIVHEPFGPGVQRVVHGRPHREALARALKIVAAGKVEGIGRAVEGPQRIAVGIEAQIEAPGARSREARQSRLRAGAATGQLGAGIARAERTGADVAVLPADRGVVRVAEVGGDIASAVVEIRAHDDIEIDAAAVGARSRIGLSEGRQHALGAADAVFRVKEPTLKLRVESLKIPLEAKVDDAGDGVGAVDGGSAAGQHLDLLDELRRNLVEIGGHLGRRAEGQALAVDENQRALRAEPAQIDGGNTGIDARKGALPGEGLGQRIDEVLDSGDAPGVDFLVAEHRDRTGRGQIGSREPRAGNDNLFDDRRRIRAGGLLGGGVDAARGEQNTGPG